MEKDIEGEIGAPVDVSGVCTVVLPNLLAFLLYIQMQEFIKGCNNSLLGCFLVSCIKYVMTRICGLHIFLF